jgi:hypothetical protein
VTFTTLITALVAWSLGAMFLVAGAQKWSLGGAYARLLAGHGLLPAVMLKVAAPVLAFGEMMLGIWLISMYLVPIALALSLSVCIAFMVYRVALAKKGTASCGCFGTAGKNFPADVQVGAGAIYVGVAATGVATSQTAAALSLHEHLLASAVALATAVLLLQGAARIRGSVWRYAPAGPNAAKRETDPLV